LTFFGYPSVYNCKRRSDILRFTTANGTKDLRECWPLAAGRGLRQAFWRQDRGHRSSLVCSFAALNAFRSRARLRNSTGSVGVGPTTALLPASARCPRSAPGPLTPGPLTPGARSPPRASLVCSFAALGENGQKEIMRSQNLQIKGWCMI